MLRICQAAQSQRANQSLSKSVSEPTHGRKKRKHDCTTLYKQAAIKVGTKPAIIPLSNTKPKPAKAARHVNCAPRPKTEKSYNAVNTLLTLKPMTGVSLQTNNFTNKDKPW